MTTKNNQNMIIILSVVVLSLVLVGCGAKEAPITVPAGAQVRVRAHPGHGTRVSGFHWSILSPILLRPLPSGSPDESVQRR